MSFDTARCLAKQLSEASSPCGGEFWNWGWNEQQQALREAEKLREDLETRKTVDRAKGILIDRGMSEHEVYQYIQRKARDNRSSMRDVAEKILAKDQQA